MADTDQPANEPNGDRIGNDYQEGPNPNPGGDVDTGDSLVPPYEGRSTGYADNEEKVKRADRPISGGSVTEEPVQPESSADTVGQGEMAPDNVGQSVGRRGEDVSDRESEPGRETTGRRGDTERPEGTSSARDRTSVDPQD